LRLAQRLLSIVFSTCQWCSAFGNVYDIWRMHVVSAQLMERVLDLVA
jgi:hypothetical protein